MFMDFAVVGVGGFLGSCLRFALTKMAAWLGVSFPLGTLLSNVIAGAAIGYIIGLDDFQPKTRLFITTGLLGGLSTFSTFSLETVELFGEGKYFLCALNVILNLGLSLLGVALGMLAARSAKIFS